MLRRLWGAYRQGSEPCIVENWIEAGIYLHQRISSWWLQPLWNIYQTKWESSPNRGENKTYLKPPPTVDLYKNNITPIKTNRTNQRRKSANFIVDKFPSFVPLFGTLPKKQLHLSFIQDGKYRSEDVSTQHIHFETNGWDRLDCRLRGSTFSIPTQAWMPRLFRSVKFFASWFGRVSSDPMW